MLNFGFKKEIRTKRERRENRVNLDVKKVLGSADQKLIVMVRS